MKSLKRVKRGEEVNNNADNPNIVVDNFNNNNIQQSIQLVNVNEQANLGQTENQMANINDPKNNQMNPNQQEIKPDIQPEPENNQNNNEGNLIQNPQATVNEVSQNKIPQKVENKIQNEFKHIFTNDMFSNNSYRKRLLHFTFVCIVVDILILQILW
jgi:hypothetical protein